MSNYNIIFDFNNNIECLYHNSLLHEELLHDDYKLWDKCKPKAIGTFILDFINTDFEKEKSFNNFILKYCFLELFNEYMSNSKMDKNKYYNKKKMISIKEKDLPSLLKKLYKNFSDDLNYNRDLFIRLTSKIIFNEEDENEIKKLAKFKAMEKQTESEKEIYNELKSQLSSIFSYDNDLNSLSSEIKDLRLNFVMDDFFPYNKDGTLSKNIPYSFKSDNYLCILFISFKQLLYINKDMTIRKCANCGKYFIPKTMHDTKYCDEIFKNNKTCKEIGRELTFKEKLDKNPLLKNYRTRYQTLSKQAAERDTHEMYEYFKKVGPEMRKKYIDNEITAKEFQDWINSTKVRKK